MARHGGLPPYPGGPTPVIDKLAEYVARNGVKFETSVRAKNDPRFRFPPSHSRAVSRVPRLEPICGVMEESGGIASADMNTAGHFKIQSPTAPSPAWVLPGSSGLERPGPAVRPSVDSITMSAKDDRDQLLRRWQWQCLNQLQWSSPAGAVKKEVLMKLSRSCHSFVNDAAPRCDGERRSRRPSGEAADRPWSLSREKFPRVRRRRVLQEEEEELGSAKPESRAEPAKAGSRSKRLWSPFASTGPC
ncbi:hypothetical protein CRUP_003467 [Coryphaenoides rupestris]|nr:hypothetical protein CRUP_003467 [Coryphaenoides rupestris]